MTNARLIRQIESGTATDGARGEYARRIRKLKIGWPCKHGHFDCALVDRGPCLDETLAGRTDGGHTEEA